MLSRRQMAQSSPIDTFPEALAPIPELEAETGPITLPKVCTELILDIAEYLPPSGYMSLSYSCRMIRNKMGAYFAEVLGDTDPKGELSGSTLSIESRNIRYLERLELWSMLVRDGKIPLRKVWSGGYQTKIIDDCSSITTRLYEPISRGHRGLATTGILWVCPHRILDHEDVTMGWKTDDHHMCGNSFVSSSGGVGVRWSTTWSIMMIPANSVPTSKEVMEALRPLEAPICPHLRLNDASVARIYNPRCQNLHSNRKWKDPASACRCSNCVSRKLFCSYCDTAVSFDIRPYLGQARLCLFIWRTKLFGRSFIERDWIAQVARPADLEDYKRAWEATNAECARRFGRSF